MPRDATTTVSPDDYPFAHRVRVRFAETDAMAIAHHASYLPWLEEARVAFLRAIGYPYASIRADGLDFAVVEATVRYLRPARFDDELAVHVGVADPPRATFALAYLLRRGDETMATARTVHAAVAPDGSARRPPEFITDPSLRVR